MAVTSRILVRQNRNCPGIAVCARPSTRVLGRAIATLRVRHASNRVAICVAPMEFGFDPLLSRSEPRSCFFMPVSAPRSTMLSRCSMPPQPDQLRCRHDRHDRHDNGERCTYRRRNGTKREFFNDFSRACARVRARRGGFVQSNTLVIPAGSLVRRCTSLTPVGERERPVSCLQIRSKVTTKNSIC